MAVTDTNTDVLTIAGVELRSRLLLGTGGFRSLDALDLPGAGRGVAVAVDQEVVPRGQWGKTQLHEGARVEILRAIQGG